MLSGSVSMRGFSLPAVLGSNATFSCPLGLELIGPNSSTCMQNGEWEPDPREVSCRGVHVHPYWMIYAYVAMIDMP